MRIVSRTYGASAALRPARAPYLSVGQARLCERNPTSKSHHKSIKVEPHVAALRRGRIDAEVKALDAPCTPHSAI